MHKKNSFDNIKLFLTTYNLGDSMSFTVQIGGVRTASPQTLPLEQPVSKRKQLKQLVQQYAEHKQMLYDAKKMIAEGQSQIASGQRKFAEAQEEKKVIEAKRTEIDAKRTEVELKEKNLLVKAFCFHSRSKPV